MKNTMEQCSGTRCLFGRLRINTQCMNFARHHIRKRTIDQLVPGQRTQARELWRHNGDAVVTRATGGAGMTGMQMAVVIDMQLRWRKGGLQTLADQVLARGIHDVTQRCSGSGGGLLFAPSCGSLPASQMP